MKGEWFVLSKTNARMLRKLHRLGASALAVTLWLPVLLTAQNATPEQERQNQPRATERPAKSPPGPVEKRSSDTAPGQLQLETPEAATPATKSGTQAQPAPKLTTPAKPGPSDQEGHKPTIESISLRGNRRISAQTLRARIVSHPGDVYDEDALERDFMALWNTGFLDDVRLEAADAPNGNKLVTFYVREKKLIRSIDYKGLNAVQQSDVLDVFKKEKVGLSIQSQYDPVLIKHAEVVLQELLAAHGKMFSTVRHRTRNIPPNSVALTFVVVEGPTVKVGHIAFTGNKVFTDRALMRSMKYSRPLGAPPCFYWLHKTYDKERVEADLENIRDLYRDQGYFYALPKEPDIKLVDTGRRPFFFWSAARGKRVDVTIEIEEAAQYRLGSFHIRGNKLFTQQVLAPVLGMKQGDIFALAKVRKSIENYTKLYGGWGYINFTASPDIEPDNRRKVINLTLDFEEDQQFRVHRIDFSGNTKTRDKVIRRELLQDEGGVFNSQLWDFSVLKMNQLGFFEMVKKEDYDIKQNSKNKTVDILIKVKEKGRNSIGMSGGMSGMMGNSLGFNYATNNLLGLGLNLNLALNWGTFMKMFNFGFTEPYLFDRPITAGFNLSMNRVNNDQIRQMAGYTGVDANLLAQSNYAKYLGPSYIQNSTGFSLFASYPLRRSFARVGITYNFAEEKMLGANSAAKTYLEALNFNGLTGANALNGYVSSSIMPTYIYSTIDNPMMPSNGKYLFLAVSFSGSAVGGSINTIRPVIEAKYFKPVRKIGTPYVQSIGLRFMTSTVTGYGGRAVPPSTRFYMGGEQDLRSFDMRMVSPMVFFPSVTSVCNRNNNGQPITSTTQTGASTGSCGSSTSFPVNSPMFTGGDTEALFNFEYRIPIMKTASVSFFTDIGMNSILWGNQLKLATGTFSSMESQYPYFPTPQRLSPISGTNFKPRAGSGLDFQVFLPIVNQPIHLYYGYNWLRLNKVITPPQNLPPESLFPNPETYLDAMENFRPFRVKEKEHKFGFTVMRTF